MRSRILLSTAVAVCLMAPVFSLPAMADNAMAPTSHAAAKGETVEERITNLHSELQITPDEEGKWGAVAQAMRDNAAKMEKMVADKHDKNPSTMTAKDDLKTYEEFAKAHVEGLKSLRSAFDGLYDMMPADQQKNADQVFADFGHKMHGESSGGDAPAAQ